MKRTNHRAAVSAVLLAVSIGLVGCTAKISHLSLASVESVDLSQKYTLAASDVSAKSSQTFVLLYFGGEDMSYFKALGDLLAEHGGDIVTDLQVTSTSYWFLIGAYTEYRVKGNVWKRVDTSDAQLSPAQLFTLERRDGRTVLVSEDGRIVHEVARQSRG